MAIHLVVLVSGCMICFDETGRRRVCKNGSAQGLSTCAEFSRFFHFGCDPAIRLPGRPGGQEWRVLYLFTVCSTGPKGDIIFARDTLSGFKAVRKACRSTVKDNPLFFCLFFFTRPVA